MAPRDEDIAWNFGDPIDGNKRRIKCKFCNKIINGGITRLKQHLAHERGDVAPCESVSQNVKKRYDGVEVVIMMKGVLIFHRHYIDQHQYMMLKIVEVEMWQCNQLQLQRQDCEPVRYNWKRLSKEKTNEAWHGLAKESKKRKLTKAFGNWMIDTNQAFRSIESPYTNQLMETIREYPNVRAPSAYDIADSVDATDVYKKDANYCFRLMKKVVEVGEERVVQIVTDNEAAMKAAGKQMMEAFSHLYLTACNSLITANNGFIYEAMERCKLAIKRDCPYYKTYWKMIDKRWNFQLHTDLHAAGVKNAISRLERDIEREVRALQQHTNGSSNPLNEWLEEAEQPVFEGDDLAWLDDDDNSDGDGDGDNQDDVVEHMALVHHFSITLGKVIKVQLEVKLLYRRLVVTTEVIVAVTVMMKAIIHLNIQLDKHNSQIYERRRRERQASIEPVDSEASWPGLSTNVFPAESSGSNYFNDMPHIPYNGNYQSPPRRDCSLPIAGGYGSESNFPYHDNVQIFNHGTINYGGVHYHQPVYYGESSSQNEPSWMDGAGSYFLGVMRDSIM
ncbi:hypothetical protein RDABS01_005438, partial [Bienertia sinuspersici]